MTDSLNVSTITLDGLINWLSQQRKNNAAATLGDLLRGQPVDRNAVLDLACIDLMHQHRTGHPVYAEEYVQDFPQLDQTSDLLDLIDAELCVAAELQETIEIASYYKRFPDLVSEIDELAQLDLHLDIPTFHLNPATQNSGFGFSETPHSFTSSLTMAERDDQLSGFSVDPAIPPDEENVSIEKLSEDYPLAIPDWFVLDQCLARTKDGCLLRGRDDVRGVPLAMKIIRVPRLLTDAEVTDLLDVCEAASRVQNAHWIAPRMAAIQMGYLGIIRPWQFANSWQLAPFSRSTSQRQNCTESGPPDAMTNALDADESTNAELDETVVLRRWRQLAAVAFSVESAHRSGATHGAIHAGNLAVDHQGKVCVLDATSSITALERWLGKNSTGIQCLENRIQFDVDDFVSLVCETEKWMHSMTSEQLVQDVRNTASNHQQSQLACIGEVLMRYADHYQGLSIEQQPRWRARISRWWLGKN